MNLMEAFEKTVEYSEGKSDKGTIHSYIETYDKLFSPYKDSTKWFLEIGICRGSSVPLWHLYFENAKIIGIDNGIDKSAQREVVENFVANWPRAKFIGDTDAYRLNVVTDLLEMTNNEGFDIIVDDGSHHPTHQGFVMVEYGKILKPGGLMVIEDVNGDMVAQFLGLMPISYSCNIQIIDLRKNKNRFDDMMVVVHKNE